MKKDDEVPTEVDDEGKEWLLCGLENCQDRLKSYIKTNDVVDPDNVKVDDLPDEKEPKVKKIDKRASRDGYLSGKWELFVSPKRVDSIWEEIRKLISGGKIWGGQVTTKWIREKRGREKHIIRVYTPNYLDEDDVLRVGNLIKERCNIEKEIHYKPDIYNVLNIYSDKGEDRKLPKEIRYKI